MKIAFIHPSMNNLGGAELITYWLSKELSETGHTVEIITVDYNKELYPQGKIKVTKLYHKNRLIEFLISKKIITPVIWRMIASIKDFNNYIKNKNYDALIHHNYPATMVMQKSKSVWLCEEPPFLLYGNIINPYLDEVRKKKQNPLIKIVRSINKLLILNDKKNVKKFKKIICNSSYTKEKVRQIYKLNSDVCLLGIPYKEIRKTKTKNKEFTFLFLSRIEPPKNLRWVIKAMSELKHKARLLVIGNGSEREELEELAKNMEVKFLGAVSEEEKNKTIISSDAVVFPARHEPFGLIPLEAMMRWKPVIGLNDGGIRETVKNNYNGLLINNEEELKSAMTKLIRNPELAEKLGENGHELMKKEFTIKQVAKRLLEYL